MCPPKCGWRAAQLRGWRGAGAAVLLSEGGLRRSACPGENDCRIKAPRAHAPDVDEGSSVETADPDCVRHPEHGRHGQRLQSHTMDVAAVWPKGQICVVDLDQIQGGLRAAGQARRSEKKHTVVDRAHGGGSGQHERQPDTARRRRCGWRRWWRWLHRWLSGWWGRRRRRSSSEQRRWWIRCAVSAPRILSFVCSAF